MQIRQCDHLKMIATVKKPQSYECDECVAMGDRWVHLRTCQECGVTRCCDSSPNRHARKHTEASGHPVIAPAEPREYWLYCHLDDSISEYSPE